MPINTAGRLKFLNIFIHFNLTTLKATKMNLHELNQLLLSLKKNKIKNAELITFYSKMKRELTKKLSTEVNKILQVNLFKVKNN